LRVQPFSFIANGGYVRTGVMTNQDFSGLQIVRYDAATDAAITKTYQWVGDATRGGDLTVDGGTSLVPEGFTIPQFSVRGIDHTAQPIARSQPYVRLSFTLENTHVDPPLTREFETLVTSREYLR